MVAAQIRENEMTAQAIASVFSRIVREELAADLADIITANRTLEYASACATHDACDANMLMHDAFSECKIEMDPESDEHCALWNAAWDISKAAEFQN